jgi:hypothetical protein
MIYSILRRSLVLAFLIIAVVKLHPVTPEPVDRGHQWDCELWRYCE